MALSWPPWIQPCPGAQAGLEHGLRCLETLAAQRHLVPIWQLEDGLVGLRELLQELSLVVQGHPTCGIQRGN